MKRIMLSFTMSGLVAAGCVPASDTASQDAPVQEVYLDALSLKDVSPDCEGLLVDPAGRLVPVESMRRCMDYYLSATGESSDRQIRRAFRWAMHQQLPKEARREAVGLFDRYTEFRAAGQTLVAGEPDADVWIEKVRQLRTSLFSPEWDKALFRADDRAQDALQTAQSTRGLVAESAAQTRLDTADGHLRAVQATAAMKALGRTDAQIHAYRTEVFGENAAERLAAVDRARADLEARYADYRRARAGGNLSNAEIEALLDARFTPQEKRRIRAWDRIRHGG